MPESARGSVRGRAASIHERVVAISIFSSVINLFFNGRMEPV
jgi:hypothetical protein